MGRLSESWGLKAACHGECFIECGEVSGVLGLVMLKDCIEYGEVIGVFGTEGLMSGKGLH